MDEDKEQTRQFVIAVKQLARPTVGHEWQKALSSTPGVELVGASTYHAQVEATPEGIGALRAKLGGDFLIEEEMLRDPL